MAPLRAVDRHLGLPDGTYWLSSGADPLDLIDETKESDNRYDLKIEITGDAVIRV